MDETLTLKNPSPSLHNADLAPLPRDERSWDAFSIFNVWTNDIQSLFGYTLAATLFLNAGINGWWVFAGIVVAGLIVMVLVNMVGRPSVKYGVPFPVLVRGSMGVRGANLPVAMRAVIAVFWYGAQTYFGSSALAILFYALWGGEDGATFLGMTGTDWLAYVVVAAFQIALFVRGVEGIKNFLNLAGPLVYALMIALALVIWFAAGNDIFAQMGSIFTGETGAAENAGIGAFFGVVGTMVAYFSAVIIAYGDFSRFCKTESGMRMGNLLGLPVSLTFFSFLAMFITAGTVGVFGEPMTNPSDVVSEVDNLALTFVAAIAFFLATVGINLVANFIPPSYDLANLAPERISAQTGGLITATIGFVVGGLWVAVISQIGITGFVDTLGAVIAPFLGVLLVDFYVLKDGRYDLEALFSADPDAAYHYEAGWNRRALMACGIAAIFSIATVWVPLLESLAGFSLLIGAALGAGLYYGLMQKAEVPLAAQAKG